MRMVKNASAEAGENRGNNMPEATIRGDMRLNIPEDEESIVAKLHLQEQPRFHGGHL